MSYTYQPAHVAQWSRHFGTMCSRVLRAQKPGSNLSPGLSAYERIIFNDSYARDEQGDNPVQEKRV